MRVVPLATMFHFKTRLNHRSGRGAQTAVGLFLALAGSAGCDENSITNNYFNLQPTPQDAGVDAEAPQETPDAAATSKPTDTSAPAEDAGVSTEGPADANVSTGSQTSSPEASVSEPGTSSGALDAGDVQDAAPALPLEEGAPVVTSTPAELDIDLFGTFDNKFWFVVSQEQVDRMNQRDYGGGWYGGYGDIYAPNTPDSSSNKTYAEHLLVTNDQGQTADFGKVQTKVVGQSTFRPWTESTLPNIRVDVDDFVKESSIDGFEHLRFNNALVGSIFREKFAFDYYREMGYPAPFAGYGWVSNSIWGEGIEVPYVVVEVYKRNFCNQRLDYFGGECPNMWEFYGDFGYGWWGYGGGGIFDNPDNCQFDTCDSTRAMELEYAVTNTPAGPGFKDTLSEYVDWDAFHDFQCLSWIFATGDDTFHNNNNVVIVERPDGKFQWLPYSVDISFGQEWYRYVQLPGQNAMARGCQADPDCWADTIAACDVMLDKFVASDPVARLDALYNELDEAGMLRSGDDDRYQDMRGYIEERLADMPGELDLNRDEPYYGPMYCGYPYVACGGDCLLPRDCDQCGEYYLGGHDYNGYYGYGYPVPPPMGVPGVPVPVDAVPVDAVPVDAVPVDVAPVEAAAPAIVIVPPKDPIPPPPPVTEEPPPVGDAGAPNDVDGGFEIPPLCRPYAAYEDVIIGK